MSEGRDFTEQNQREEKIDSFEERIMSRRDFLRLSCTAILGGAFALSKINGHVFAEFEETEDNKEIPFLENGPDEITSLGAIIAAADEFEGQPYTWESPILHCSGFVGRYMKHLGFEVARDTIDAGLYEPDVTKAMPESTTVKQAEYLRAVNSSLGGDLATEVPVKQVLTDIKLWEQIPPGAVMYLPVPIGHNGYDTYTHTAIFMGLDLNREPRFAEFSSYMENGPEYGHGIDKFSVLYEGKSIEPTDPSKGQLKVFMFDAVEASRRFGLEKGVVEPDLELFKKLGYDNVVSVNINDGRVSMWDITEQEVKKRRIGEREEMFSVLGRRLKRNKYLLNEYMQKMASLHPLTTYDSGSGCYIDEYGVRRTTYTPAFIAELAGTEVLSNFGGLGADTHTDICLLSQLYYGRYESKIVSKKYSPYTLHEVPRGTADQEILLREPALVKANTEGKPVENHNLSSGCVNLDGESWEIIKQEFKSLQKDGKRIAVMFSTPRTNQKSLIKNGTEESWFYQDDPFGGQIEKWGYSLQEGVGHDSWIYYKRDSIKRDLTKSHF